MSSDRVYVNLEKNTKGKSIFPFETEISQVEMLQMMRGQYSIQTFRRKYIYNKQCWQLATYHTLYPYDGSMTAFHSWKHEVPLETRTHGHFTGPLKSNNLISKLHL